MKCVMTRGIYLRSNGDLPCYCSAGSLVKLGKLDLTSHSDNFATDHYFGAQFQHIRDFMQQDRVPFPGICEQCVYLEVDSPSELEKLNKEIEWFHWEPSYRCNLDCSWCIPEKNKVKKQIFQKLPLDNFMEVVKSLSRYGLTLNKGNICGQGEPTLHKEVWKMVSYVKRKLTGNILVSTNGNTIFKEQIIESGLDKIKIAIDGITQDTYSRYRKNGKLDRVLRLTKEIAIYKRKTGNKSPLIIWQYIIFNYNDTDEELIELQKMALDYEVNILRMVYTRSSNYSPRKPQDFPKIFPNIVISEANSNAKTSIFALNQRLEEADKLMSSGKFKQASLILLKLLQKCYARFIFGSETVEECFSFTHTIKPIQTNNPHTLTKEEYLNGLHIFKESYLMLINIYELLGDKTLSKAYQRYLNQLKIVT